jgi:dTDP-4-dehydrorhamnose reductase
MHILILGGAGMLGHKLWQVCRDRFDTWTTLRQPVTAYRHIGVFDPARCLDGVRADRFETVERAIAERRPQVVVNCIGIVKQLKDGADPVPSVEINSLFPHRLARAAADHGARLIHISTDCVFSGRTGGYTEDDPADADDLYGRSKRLGEPAGSHVLTVRTSIVGRELHGAHGLFEWFLGHRGGRVKGFARAYFSGLTTQALAETLVEVVERHPSLSGTYHVAGDRISKYDLLALVNDACGAGVTIDRDETFSIDRSLDGSRFRAATGWSPSPWPEMVAAFAADPTPYDEWRQR